MRTRSLPSLRLLLLLCAVTAHGLGAQGAGDTEDPRKAIVRLRAEAAEHERLNRPKEAGAAWNQLGHAFFELERYDSAGVAYRRGLVARQAAADSLGIAASTNNIGNVFSELGPLDSAVVYYDRAIALYRRIGERSRAAWTLRNLARAHDHLSSGGPPPDAAFAALRAALAIHDSLGASSPYDIRIQALTEMADLQERAGRLDSARVYFQRSVAAASRAKDAFTHAESERRIGGIFTQQGRSDSALTHYRTALRIARAAGESAIVGYTLLDMGADARRAGRLGDAARDFREARAVFRAAGTPDDEAEALRQLAYYYKETARPDSAVLMMGEAIAIFRAQRNVALEARALAMLPDLFFPFPLSQRAVMRDSSRRVLGEAQRLAMTTRDRSLQAFTFEQLGDHFDYWGAEDSSRVQRYAALEIHRALGQRADEARLSVRIGQTHTALDSITRYTDAGLRLAREIGARSDVMTFSLDAAGHLARTAMRADPGEPYRDQARVYLREALALAREAQRPELVADALEAFGTLATNATPRRWAEAAAYFDSAATVREAIHASAGDDAARIAVAERDIMAWQLLAWAWGERAAETGAQDDLRRALAARERGRARALLRMRGPTAGVALQGPLDSIAASLIAATARAETATLLYNVGTDETSVLVILPSGRLERYGVRIPHDSLTARIDALRAGLGVERAAVRTAAQPLEAERATAGTRGVQARASSAQALAEGLQRVAETVLPTDLRATLARERIRELVIVTDRELGMIPFAALPLDPQGTPLGAQLALRFTPSLALALAPRTATAPRGAVRGSDALVVGNPLMPRVTTVGGAVPLEPLPGAAAEAELIASALGTRALGGADASEATVREALASARVVHLATHGYAYGASDRVHESFVALAPGGGQDGLLTVGELIDDVPAIAAELVVLSACQTGLGTATSAEGTVGLQRAFLAKGAQSLLVSLWSVDDAVTTTLMARFYHHWLGGASKAEALRLAQADVRRTHPNPRFWAAFQLVGSD